MTVEAATWIDDLDPTLPDGDLDGIAEGDNHFRMLKQVLLTTFPNATGAGAKAVEYTPTKTGSLARTVHDTLDDFISVTNFTGCDKTGATSSVAAFNSAKTQGGTIRIPKGTYLLDSDITLSGVWWFEAGAMIKAGGTATVTITGQILAPDKAQIFDWDIGAGFSITQQDQISVNWFCAAPSTDATDGTKKAVLSFPNGGVILFPGDLYRIFDTIHILQSRVVLKGVGKENTIIHKRVLDADLFYFYSGDDADVMTGCGVYKLTITTDAAESHSAGAAIHFRVVQFPVVSEVSCVNQYNGIVFTSCQGTVCSDVVCAYSSTYLGQGQACFDFDETVSAAKRENSNTFLVNCRAQAATGTFKCNYGYRFRSTDGCWLINSYSGSMHLASVQISPQNGTTQVTGVLIDQTWLDPVNTTGSGIIIDGGTTDSFGGFKFTDCRIRGGGTGLRGININPDVGQALWNIQVDSCTIDNWEDFGIVVGINSGSRRLFQINNNTLTDCGNGGGAGISVAELTKFTIANNLIGYVMGSGAATTANYALQIAATCDEYVVTGNSFRGNAGTLNDLGGPNKVVANNLS